MLGFSITYGGATGIQQVVSLVGESEIDARAKALGMNVTILDWRTAEPPAQDLKMLLICPCEIYLLIACRRNCYIFIISGK